MQWHTPITPTLWKLKQEDLIFKASLAGYIAIPSRERERGGGKEERKRESTGDVAHSVQHSPSMHKALGARLWFQFHCIPYSNNPTSSVLF